MTHLLSTRRFSNILLKTGMSQPSSRGVVVLAMTGPQAQASPVGDDDFLTPRMSVGEHISNVFSIAASVQADGFDERVGRNSGSADYTLTQTSPGPVFTFVTDGFYDGASKYHAVDIIRDGGATSCFDGKCAIYTDASGPLYNRLLWGDPPAHLKAGMTWSVTIRQPWELGPAGDQTVTVMHVDDTDGTVTLKREGSATRRIRQRTSPNHADQKRQAGHAGCYAGKSKLDRLYDLSPWDRAQRRTACCAHRSTALSGNRLCDGDEAALHAVECGSLSHALTELCAQRMESRLMPGSDLFSAFLAGSHPCSGGNL